jgi:hypothetical protein
LKLLGFSDDWQALPSLLARPPHQKVFEDELLFAGGKGMIAG